MSGITRKRQAVWAALLVGAAWLAFFGNDAPGEVAVGIANPVSSKRIEPVRAGQAAAARGEAMAAMALLALRPREKLIHASPEVPVDLFAAKSWTPPPPPPAPVPVAAPVAPPLPYTYAGKKRQDGQWEVYLLRGDLTHIVQRGSVLDGQYVVEQIEPPAMHFTYKPLGQRQTLTIGE